MGYHPPSRTLNSSSGKCGTSGFENGCFCLIISAFVGTCLAEFIQRRRGEADLRIYHSSKSTEFSMDVGSGEADRQSRE